MVISRLEAGSRGSRVFVPPYCVQLSRRNEIKGQWSRHVTLLTHIRGITRNHCNDNTFSFRDTKLRGQLTNIECFKKTSICNSGLHRLSNAACQAVLFVMSCVQRFCFLSSLVADLNCILLFWKHCELTICPLNFVFNENVVIVLKCIWC